MYNPVTEHPLSVRQLSDAGALALTDLGVVNRGLDSDFNHPLSALTTLVRRTPAVPRSAALPAVLTATDHDSIVRLTGTTGTVSVDNTVAEGFHCLVVNKASGVATYSGITGLLQTTSLSPGSSTTVYMVAGVVEATASLGSSGPATAYSMTESAAVGLTNAAVTVIFAPSGGTWPSGVTLTPAQSGVTGVFSPTTLTPTVGSTNSVSCTFTPSTAGTATISVTSGGVMTNPGNVTYTVSAVATAYTTGLSGSSGLTNATVTATFTPTAGGWPASEVITPTVSGVSGSFSPATVSTTSGSTAAVTTLFTPTSAGTAAISSTTSPSMTNTTGSQNYTVSNPTATSYTTGLSASSAPVSTPVTMTFSPVGGGWPSAQTITPVATGLTGTFSPTTISPVANSLSAVTCTFTATAGSSGTLDSTVAVSMTDTSGAQTFTAGAGAPAYPTITTAGVVRQAIFDANAGVTASGGNISALADQSGNGNNLTASVGVSVGASVNGYPSIAFASALRSANSGLSGSGSWISNSNGMENANTVAFAFKTGATTTGSGAQGYLWMFAPTAYTNNQDYIAYHDTNGKLYIWDRQNGQFANFNPVTGVLAANTVYKVVVRKVPASSTFDIWINGTKTTITQSNGANPAYTANQQTQFSIGQGALSGYGDAGAASDKFLELHAISGNLSDADCTTYETYLTNKWGS